jgi:Tol biopolymer transport system component
VCFVADLLGVLGGPAGSVKKGEMNYAAELAWSPDGTRLAVIVRDPNGLRPVDLVIVKSNGAVDLEVEVAPRDVTDTPQWTPDGQAIFVQTYPQDGRRILAVDVGSGEVIDLSREHWDTYFSLAPDGKSLLLNNGRGGFWSVEVLRSAR